jgi:hypothetical protein
LQPQFKSIQDRRNGSTQNSGKIPLDSLCCSCNGRHTRQIGPPGNQNAFRHGLAWISQRRVNGVLNSTEQSIREEILADSLAEKGANFKARSFGI